jgi:CxxC-x17-CxxC domain-containing protein
MADYSPRPRFNGAPRRPFNKPNARPGARDFAQKELYDAECAKCHTRCQVPFRPNGKKPVYCANCFNQQEDRAERPRDSYQNKREFSGPRPSRMEAAPAPSRELQELKRQVATMQATLEQLVTSFDTFNRAAALAKEIRKHVPVPAAKPASAPVKKAGAAPKAVKAVKAAPKKKAAKAAKR